MRKFDIFLREHSWLLKAGIVILMVAWATQLGPGIVHKFQEDNALGKKRDFVVEQKAAFELRSFAAGLIEKAKARGKQYSPAEYYNQLEEIDCKAEELEKKYGIDVPYAQEYVNELFNLSFVNVREGLFDIREAQRLGQKYVAKGRKSEPTGPEWIEKLATIHGWVGLGKMIFDWIATLYLRGIMLVLLWYIVSMAEWRGIVETFLADKLKFLYALVAWPVMIWRYPENIVRKIVVEAELRRLGSVWRKLDPREKRLVKQIASRSKAEYKKWVADYELKNAQRFKRSFEWALVVTVLVILLQAALPVNANADMVKLRDGPYLEQGAVYDQYDTRLNIAADDGSKVSPDNAPVWAEEMFVLPVLCLIQRIKVFFKRLRPKKLSRKIFIIPEFGYLVKGFLLQTK